jgi:hypothetical protein
MRLWNKSRITPGSWCNEIDYIFLERAGKPIDWKPTCFRETNRF